VAFAVANCHKRLQVGKRHFKNLVVAAPGACGATKSERRDLRVAQQQVLELAVLAALPDAVQQPRRVIAHVVGDPRVDVLAAADFDKELVGPRCGFDDADVHAVDAFVRMQERLVPLLGRHLILGHLLFGCLGCQGLLNTHLDQLVQLVLAGLPYLRNNLTHPLLEWTSDRFTR
jgi:hypothetical protein